MSDIIKRETTTSVKLPNPELTERILKLEEFITNECEPCEIEWVHRFAPGVYTREMIVEEDTLITGAIHKTEHISILLEGSLLVPTDDGDSVVVEAPRVEICQPGVKRAGIALERVRWITVHPTDEQDIETLERTFFTNNPADVLCLEHKPEGYEVKQKDYALAQRTQAIEHKE